MMEETINSSNNSTDAKDDDPSKSLLSDAPANEIDDPHDVYGKVVEKAVNIQKAQHKKKKPLKENSEGEVEGNDEKYRYFIRLDPLSADTTADKNSPAIKKIVLELFDIAYKDLQKNFKKEFELEKDLYLFIKNNPIWFKGFTSWMWCAVKVDVIFFVFVFNQMQALSKLISDAVGRMVFMVLSGGFGSVSNTISDVKVVDYIDETKDAIKTMLSFFRMDWPEFLINMLVLTVFIYSSAGFALSNLDFAAFLVGLTGVNWLLQGLGFPMVMMGITYYFGWTIRIMTDVCRDTMKHLMNTLGKGRSPLDANSIKYLVTSLTYITWNVLLRSAAGVAVPSFELSDRNRLNVTDKSAVNAVAFTQGPSSGFVGLASRAPTTFRYLEVYPYVNGHEQLVRYMQADNKAHHPELTSFAILKSTLRKTFLRSLLLAYAVFLLTNYWALEGNKNSLSISLTISAIIFALYAWAEHAVLLELPMVAGFHETHEYVKGLAKEIYIKEEYAKLISELEALPDNVTNREKRAALELDLAVYEESYMSQLGIKANYKNMIGKLVKLSKQTGKETEVEHLKQELDQYEAEHSRALGIDAERQLAKSQTMRQPNSGMLLVAGVCMLQTMQKIIGFIYNSLVFLVSMVHSVIDQQLGFNNTISKLRAYLCRWPLNAKFVLELMDMATFLKAPFSQALCFSALVTFVVSDNDEAFVLSSLNKTSNAEAAREQAGKDAEEAKGVRGQNEEINALENGYSISENHYLLVNNQGTGSFDGGSENVAGRFHENFCTIS